MTSIVGGFKDRKIESRSKVEPATAQYIGRYRLGQDVISQTSAYTVNLTNTVGSGSTTSTIACAGIESLARDGDIVIFTSGVLLGDMAIVQSVATDTLTLSQTLASAPVAATTFSLKRWTPLSVDSSGGITLADGNKVQGLYPDASLSLSNPIPIAAKDVFTGQTRVPVSYNNLGIDFLLMVPVDPNLAFPNFRAVTGEAFSLVASPDDTKGNSRYLNIDSTTRSAFVQGSIAHDAVDSTNPIKIGGKASTSTPTAVASGDRVDAYFDANGRLTVRLDAQPQADTSSATIPARGKIAAASLTTSYASLLSMGGAAKIIALFNSTDQNVLISLDNGTTDSIELDAYESITLDLVAAGLTVASSTISAKYVSTAPTIGSVRANVVR